MTGEKLLRWCERVLARRPPKVVAGTFFGFSMSIVLMGYLRKDDWQSLLIYILAALAVSVGALGLRWLEKHCPAPTKEQE